MKIAIGADHAGFAYKEKIKEHLKSMGHEIVDFGTNSDAPVDYPIFIHPVAAAVARGEAERGIVLAVVLKAVRQYRDSEDLALVDALDDRTGSRQSGIPIRRFAIALDLAPKALRRSQAQIGIVR